MKPDHTELLKQLLALPPEARREERWVELLRLLGADRFVIGPTARNYLDPSRQVFVKRDGRVKLVKMAPEKKLEIK